MKSLVAASVGGLSLLAVAIIDRPDPAAAPTLTSPLATIAAFDAPLSDPPARPVAPTRRALGHPVLAPAPTAIAPSALTDVVKKTCAGCHSEQRKQGNLSLQSFDMASINGSPELAEKMIGKLRAGMMPPPGRPKPGGDTLDVLAGTLERMMDARYALNPNPGTRTFQRLNRAEYERSVKDLLGVDIKAESWLPLDTKSANFDNIADVQMPSATLLDSYLDAASEISRLAVGDPKASVSTSSYKIAR